MANPGTPRIYDETLSCEVRVYFTRSQYDKILLMAGTTQTASSFLRDLFLSSLSSQPQVDAVSSPLIKPPDNLDNEGDG